MGSLQIKDLPDHVHAELRRRAKESGMSVRDYVLAMIRRDLALPSRQEWLERLQQLRTVTLDRPASEYLAEVREKPRDDAGP